ncbi:MAG TPA: D-glucuronyl C5-epimerase family protein, partial [Gaiellaceae bacterium]
MIVSAAAALAAAGVAQAGLAPLPAQKQALAAVSKALKTGRLDATSAATARAEITRATHLIRTLPAGRSEHVNVALAELGAFTGKLTQPRAVSLIGQLRENDDYFSQHYAPAPKTDVTDADGVVYRYFAGRCLEFHPLANFGALNALVAKGDVDATRRLADALIARGIYQQGGGIAWEYTFPFGGSVPWLSGMAQAVAAQSFARAAGLVQDQTTTYMREAHAAFATIPGHLLTTVAAGPWIRLYSFERLQVLNAQLQAVVSLTTYAGDAEDTQAATLAARMAQAAVSTLPRFDTGYWTYYALPSDPSPLDYQQFVVQLLKKLGPSDARFADAASRIGAYAKQPPAFMLANAGVGQVRFWLSKPSSVQVLSGAGPEKRLSLSGGWHTLGWNVPKRPGIYPVQIKAVDWAGNRASFEALPIVRATSTLTPKKRPKPPKRATAGTSVDSPSFVVGAGLPDPSQLPLAQKLGLRIVRLGVAYPAGATAPDPGVVATLQGLTASSSVVVELNLTPPFPVDPTGSAAVAAYAGSLAQQVPTLRDLVLGPAPSPTVATPTAYATVFAAVRDAVHIAVPNLPVAVSIDGAQAPKRTVAGLARALGGSAPDAVAFRPAPQAATNLWTATNVPQLVAALAKGFGGTAPPV